MRTWSLSDGDLKRYPHFDSCISTKAAISLATDSARVATHPFYPFMLYDQGWTRFAEKGKAGTRKARPIRYAARGDAYIFGYYRYLLSEPYEAALAAHNLQNAVLA